MSVYQYYFYVFNLPQVPVIGIAVTTAIKCCYPKKSWFMPSPILGNRQHSYWTRYIYFTIFFLSLGRVGKLCIFPTTQTLNMTFLMNYEKRPLAHSGAIQQKEVEKKSRHFIGKSIISRSLPFYDNYDWYANPFSAISFSSFYFSIELALEWQKHQTMVFCEGGSQQSVKISNRAYIVILFPFFALLLWNKLKSTYFFVSFMHFH